MIKTCELPTATDVADFLRRNGIPWYLDLQMKEGDTVIVRFDGNVIDPQTGQVNDTMRLFAAKTTIDELRKRRLKVVVATHIGRPESPDDSTLSTRNLIDILCKIWGCEMVPVDAEFVDQCKRQVGALEDGQVGILENLRFFPGEKSKSEADRVHFSACMAQIFDFCVLDGFGAFHNAKDASIVNWPAAFGADRCACGYLPGREAMMLNDILEGNGKLAVMFGGGPKLKDKMPAILALIPKADIVFFGGGAANTILGWKGHEMGESVKSVESYPLVQQIYDLAEEYGTQIVLPSDFILLNAKTLKTRVGTVNTIDNDEIAVDLGFQTLQEWFGLIESIERIFWNGTFGYVGKGFGQSTGLLIAAAANYVVELVTGGADTAAEVSKTPFQNSASCSSGGGAGLAFLANGLNIAGFAALAALRKAA